MKTFIKKSLQSLLLVPILALGVSATVLVLHPTEAFAQTCTEDASGGIAGGANCAKSNDSADSLFGSTGIFNTIVNVLLFIIGAVAVIMLIYGGFKYVISGGDSSAVTSAKNTILYAVIGIIVAILAYAVINFVVSEFAGGGSGGGRSASGGV